MIQDHPGAVVQDHQEVVPAIGRFHFSYCTAIYIGQLQCLLMLTVTQCIEEHCKVKFVKLWSV